MTNFEKIKNMGLKELAEFIADIADCNYCNISIRCEGKCKIAWEQWLNHEVENND